MPPSVRCATDNTVHVVSVRVANAGSPTTSAVTQDRHPRDWSATHAELYCVGGAVMCLAPGAREATRDVDALFRPSTRVREAAARVALRADVPPSWLNDAVKGWLSDRGQFEPWLELPHLSVFLAHPAYLLAMKCMAMRLGAEFQDVEDIRYLLRHLNMQRADDALAVVAQYFDESRIPGKTRLALEELLPVAR